MKLTPSRIADISHPSRAAVKVMDFLLGMVSCKNLADIQPRWRSDDVRPIWASARRLALLSTKGTRHLTFNVRSRNSFGKRSLRRILQINR